MSPMLSSTIKKRPITMVPQTRFDNPMFQFGRGLTVRKDNKPVAKVLMDVPANENINLVPSFPNGINLLRGEGWQNEPVSYVHAELISATPPRSMTSKSRVYAMRCLAGVRRYRHSSA